jgi:peptidoglycan lytic transglycosylase
MKSGMRSEPPAPRLALALAVLLLLAACGTTRDATWSGSGGNPQVGHYKLGQPYKIKGRWYYPEYDPGYSRVGTASWYGAGFHGMPTANGEVFDRERITAAHPTLPLPSVARVTNLENGRVVDVRVNDRGPFVGDRLIDLSQAAARKLGFEGQGLAPVRVDFVSLAEARGTPPRPTVARAAPAAPRRVVVASLPAPVARATAPAARAIPVAAAAEPASCPLGERFVQVGAFADAAQMRAAMRAVDGLGSVRIEPAFAGDRAVVRVRLGPVSDAATASRLLQRVAARGYADAFLTPAAGSGGRTLLSC